MTGLGVLSACASHVKQSPPPAAPEPGSVPPTGSFETEWNRAAAASAPGSPSKEWERQANRTIERAYGTALDSCVTRLDSGDPATASYERFVLDIARDGSVRHVWSAAESSILTCVRASLGQTQFAPPPYDGYPLGLVLDLSGTVDQSEVHDLAELPRLSRPAPGRITSDEAMQTAIRDMGSREGKLYVPAFASTFGELLNSSLVKCMTIPPLESERLLRGYRLIIEIAADGKTRRLLVEPDPEPSSSNPFRSPRADCLRDGLGHARLTTPPWDGFWVHFGLDNPPPAR